jgi:DNA-directed RNA polymerase subunit RPC12/RpoP
VSGYSHKLGELIAEKSATCAENGMNAHYVCSECNNYFDENGQKTTEFALTRVAGHAFGELIPFVEPTSDKEGMKAHYECADCKKLFDENKAETDIESLTIPALADTEAIDPEVTEPEATESQVTEPEATDPETSGGCASSLGGIAVAAVSLLGAVIIIRKKENGGN